MSDFSMQIELWKQCNNFCEFCYLADQNKFVSDDIKISNLEKANMILDRYFLEHNESIKAVGFLGGEFFQGQMSNPTVKEKFYNLCKKCFHLINEDKIRDFWCYCTLTIGDQEDLYELINLFDSVVKDKEKHKFWIQVSYDTRGRFNQPGKFENWNKHMLNLQKYPFICFNVTSIMTEDFLQKVLSGELDLVKFQERYKNAFFFKQPNAINDKTKSEMLKNLPWFFAKRQTYLKFLKKLKMNNTDLFKDILNITLRSDFMFNQLEDEDIIDPQIRDKTTWEETRSDTINKCGHPLNYQCYSDSDECCLCDYFKVTEDI